MPLRDPTLTSLCALLETHTKSRYNFKVLLLCLSKCGIVPSFLILNGFSASPGDGAGDSEGQRPRRLQRKKRIQLPNGRRHGCKFVCRSKTGSDCRGFLKTFFLTKSQTEEAIDVFVFFFVILDPSTTTLGGCGHWTQWRDDQENSE